MAKMKMPTKKTLILVQAAYRSWTVVEFKIQIFQAWKVVELGLGPGKSWKVNQMVAAFVTSVRFRPLHTLSLSTVRLGSICCYELCYILNVI